MRFVRRSTGPSFGVWFVRLLLMAIVVAIWAWPPLTSLNATTETARITNYAAVMDLSADGTLKIVETVDVAMPPGKHGIYRIFDTTDERRRGVGHPVTVVSVTRNGTAEPYAWTGSASGTRTLRIGSPDDFIEPGLHTYVVTSTTTNALNRAAAGRSQWWWNIVGSGWQMPMDATSVTASLPAAPVKSECFQGKDTPCTVSVAERMDGGQVGRTRPRATGTSSNIASAGGQSILAWVMRRSTMPWIQDHTWNDRNKASSVRVGAPASRHACTIPTNWVNAAMPAELPFTRSDDMGTGFENSTR